VKHNTEDVMTYPRGPDDIDNRYRFIRFLTETEGQKIHEDAIDVKLSLQ
jgi:hypothetical protein